MLNCNQPTARIRCSRPMHERRQRGHAPLNFHTLYW